MVSSAAQQSKSPNNRFDFNQHRTSYHDDCKLIPLYEVQYTPARDIWSRGVTSSL